MKYFVYILKCSDNTFYTGITTDMERRIWEHNNDDKKGSKYTKKRRRPVKKVFEREFENRSETSKEEWRIKKLSREGGRKFGSRLLQNTKSVKITTYEAKK